MIGKTISHYKIIEKIGEGGMGVIYKAHDLKLDRFVALKFLPAHLGKDDTQKHRFFHEAKAISALDHPNICTIYEIDQIEPESDGSMAGQIFIAMAYYDGQTLEEKMASNTPLPVDETISIIIQIAQGLRKAHEKGIVHRDIKPANIIIPNEAEVKIVDFGLAKLKGQPRLTKEETTLGTIAYMSPEQTRGGDIDERADIWSLGIIFYEMLTGKSPFAADYDQAIIYNILNTAPEPVNQLNKDVPPELNDILQKCLEKNRDNRYQTIGIFYSDLIRVIKKYRYTIRMTTGEFHPAGLTDKKIKLKPTLSVAVTLIVISAVITILFFMSDSKYTSYEKAFFEKQFEESRDDSENDRSLENVKAHRYYILSTAFTNQDTMPEKIKQEYHNLLIQNPDSPLAHYYMGLIYFVSGKKLSERDSVWILYDKAEDLGLNNIYLKLDELIYYQQIGFNQKALDVVDILIEKYPENPDVMFEIASFYQTSDTSRASSYYKQSLHLYDNFLSAHLGLFQLALKKNNFISANLFLDKAAEINAENIEVIMGKIRLYEGEGKFDLAEKYLKTAISSFGKNDIQIYISLSRLYQKQDLFEKCDELITKAAEKFPNESYFTELKMALKQRKEWLRIQEKHKNDKNIIQWSENFEDSMERAVRDKKPVLIEFYTTWEFWSKILEEKTYPDQRVQEVLKSYIPVRINAEIRKDLANKYDLSFFPAFLILNENGKKLEAVRYYLEPPGPLTLIKDLNSGLALHKKFTEGTSVADQQITEVSNIADAMLLSKSKHMPVMAFVFSKESKWSNKMVNETFNQPMLQSELKKVIMVKVDQAVNKSLIKEWDITYFPTILFLDDQGKILYQVHGCQSGPALVDLITDLNNAMIHNNKFKDRIGWLYDIEEAKSYAMLQKKDIFVFVNADWCPHCRRARDYVFTDPFFIKTVNDKFVSVELDEVGDKEIINSFGIPGFPTFLILDASLEEISRVVGYLDATALLTGLDPQERKPIFSILGPEKYKKFCENENFSNLLFDINFYRSAIRIMHKQIEIIPQYWQSYYMTGKAYLLLNEPGETVSYYSQALDKGAEINQEFAEEMLNAYLQLNDAPGFERWLRNTVKIKIKQNKETAILYNVYSEFYEIQMDRKSAILMAEKTLKVKPDYSEACIQLGRLYYLENRLDKAKFYLTKSTQMDGDDPRSRFYLGLIADREADIAAKEYYFNMAREKYGRSMRTVGWRGEYQSRPGYFLYPGYLDLIEQDYRYMLELDDNMDVKNDFAYFLAVENRNLNEALQLTEENLELEQDDVTILGTKAVILYQQGEYQKANETVLQFEDRITRDDLENTSTVSPYYLGRIKWAVGDKVSAKKYFKYALKQTESDVIDKRNQQTLIKFMTEQKLL